MILTLVDWTEVSLFEKLATIIALVTGRIFIGPEMNRDPEYMSCIIRYTVEVFMAAMALKNMNPWLRNLYARIGWVPEVNQVWASYSTMCKVMEPLIKQRVEMMESGKCMPDDLVTWNMLNSPPSVRNSVKVGYKIPMLQRFELTISRCKLMHS
jgi:hypothetical protein